MTHDANSGLHIQNSTFLFHNTCDRRVIIIVLLEHGAGKKARFTYNRHYVQRKYNVRGTKIIALISLDLQIHFFLLILLFNFISEFDQNNYHDKKN